MTVDSTSHQIEELRRVLLKPEALVDKISPVIADILAEQIEHSPDGVAKAISPIIGEALRRQVYQAREDIIDALYPVIGQTINRAVAEAIQQLAERVDTGVRQRIRLPRPIRALQARMRGVSPEELASSDQWLISSPDSRWIRNTWRTANGRAPRSASSSGETPRIRACRARMGRGSLMRWRTPVSTRSASCWIASATARLIVCPITGYSASMISSRAW
jgi:hypothetical protein